MSVKLIQFWYYECKNVLVLESETIRSSVITSCVCQISFSTFTRNSDFAKFIVQNLNWELLQITILIDQTFIQETCNL